MCVRVCTYVRVYVTNPIAARKTAAGVGDMFACVYAYMHVCVYADMHVHVRVYKCESVQLFEYASRWAVKHEREVIPFIGRRLRM